MSWSPQKAASNWNPDRTLEVVREWDYKDGENHCGLLFFWVRAGILCSDSSSYRVVTHMQPGGVFWVP